MAFQIVLSYARSLDRTSIVVTDETGLYDATDNPTGYGGPNPLPADFTTFLITAYLVDSSTALPSTTTVEIDAYPSLPSSANGTFTITSLALLGTADEQIPDGVYQFDLAALYGDDDTEATATNYGVFYEIAACCIQNMLVEAISCGCSGGSQKIQTLTKAYMNIIALRPYMDGAELMDSPIVQCQQWNKAATAILELQDVCDNENCGGCNGCH